jgi:hypothetical protein
VRGASQQVAGIVSFTLNRPVGTETGEMDTWNLKFLAWWHRYLFHLPG